MISISTLICYKFFNINVAVSKCQDGAESFFGEKSIRGLMAQCMTYRLSTMLSSCLILTTA